MPWKLILFIFLIVVIAVFMGANLDNKSTISLIFYKTQPVPVYLIILYSFCAGVLITLPFTIGKRKRSEKKADKETKSLKKTEIPAGKKFGGFFAKHDKTDIKTEETADTSTYEDKI